MVQTRSSNYMPFPGIPDSSESMDLLRRVSFEEVEVDTVSLVIDRMDVEPSMEVEPSTVPDVFSQPKHDDSPQESPTSVVPFELLSYWHSKDAKKLFCPKPNETTEEAVDDMINSLKAAIEGDSIGEYSEQGIEGQGKYKPLNDEQKLRIYYKAGHLFVALSCARATINERDRFSFGICCEEAVAYLAPDVPDNYRVKAATVGKWFRDFRKARVFSHPYARKQNEMEVGEALAAFFSQNVQLHNACKHYMTRFLRAGVTDSYACHLGYEYFVRTILRATSEFRGYNETEFPQRVLADCGLRHLDAQNFASWYAEILHQ